MSRISNLAGFTTSITSTTNLNAGIVTATSFVGNVTGTASTASFATTSFGLSGTPNITVGVSTFSGIATHTAALFGTTASFTGVVTATSYVGSGSSLTGITGKAAAMALVFGG